MSKDQHKVHVPEGSTITYEMIKRRRELLEKQKEFIEMEIRECVVAMDAIDADRASRAKK